MIQRSVFTHRVEAPSSKRRDHHLAKQKAKRIHNRNLFEKTSKSQDQIEIDCAHKKQLPDRRCHAAIVIHPDHSSMSSIPVRWPDGTTTMETIGEDWLKAASHAGVSIPTGCLGGSCGACEIEVNGKMVRACISTVPPSKSGELVVTFATDPYW